MQNTKDNTAGEVKEKLYFSDLMTELFKTQDMNENTAIRLSNYMVHGCFDYKKDPISGIIGNAVVSNRNDDNYDEMILDISYAINQLQKAKTILQRINTNN